MTAWKVYYDDGSTYDSGDGRPETAPARGVIAVVSPDPTVGRVVDCGKDYYCWRDDGATFYGMDQFGLWDYLASPGWKRVLFGRSVPTDEYHRIVQRAVRDEAFPDKSAWDDDREDGRPPEVDLP